MSNIPDDDDDMGAMWREVKALRAVKRASNREASATLLKSRGISFESKNWGAHLIVTHSGTIVDFWPGTGKFIFRNKSHKGHGIFNLLKLLHIT